MKKNNYILLLFILIANVVCIGQTISKQTNKNYSEAVAIAESNAYPEAIPLFKKILLKTPNTPEVLYYLGYCYLNTANGADSAIIYLSQGITALPKQDEKSSLSVDLNLSLAKAYQLTLQSIEAIKLYEKLKTLIPSDDIVMQTRIAHEIETCYNAIELVKKSVKLDILHLGNTINSKSDDHSPLVSVDERTIFFTTRRPSSYSKLMPDGQYSDKIFISTRDSISNAWSKPEIINKLFKKEGHESGVSLTANGQVLYLFRNDIDGKNLYESLYDGTTWNEPSKLPRPINSDFNETHCTISPDNSVMYFTSDRPGGFGGLDIYQIRKLPAGQWANPQNLGDIINTPYDEETPMLHPDGKTLYFSSEGHNSMGGFDIFISRLQNDSLWSEPKNIGYPINTPGDDLFFAPTISYNHAYYASSLYGNSQGGMDIYQVQYEEPEDNKLAVLKGVVNTATNSPLENVKITVQDNATGEKIGEYRPHPSTGVYVIILEADKTYSLNYQGEGLEPVEKNIIVNRQMTYYNSQKAKPIEAITMVLIPSETAAIDTNVTNQEDEIPGYTVQILALKKPVKSWNKAFKNLDQSQIKEYACKKGWYLYSFGNYKGFKAAVDSKNNIISITPFSDSFIREAKQYNDLIKDDSK